MYFMLSNDGDPWSHQLYVMQFTDDELPTLLDLIDSQSLATLSRMPKPHEPWWGYDVIILRGDVTTLDTLKAQPAAATTPPALAP